MDSLENYLEQVIKGMRTTEEKYANLAWPDRKTYPIPYFGDIAGARVLTVGVNPSAGEFSKKRRWPKEMSASELKDRLERYFRCDPDLPTPYPWFKTWSDTFAPLEVSYQAGAAHIDLSPRATKAMSSVDAGNFAAMLEEDIQWFFKLLSQCHHVRLLLFAGCTMDKLMERYIAKSDGFQFEKREATEGKGRIGFYCLRGSGIEIPAFFCSVSPSAWKEDRPILGERINKYRDRLLGYINEQSTPLPADEQKEQNNAGTF